MARVSYYQSLTVEQRAAHSAKHYQKAKEKKVWPTIVCAECDASYKKPEGYSYRYCSQTCRNKFVNRRASNQRRMRLSGVRVQGISFLKVYKKSGGKCAGCGALTPASLRGSASLLSPEVDHILPVACGGAHIEANLQIMCKGCNCKKGARVSQSEIASLSHLSIKSVDPQKITEDNLNRPWKNNTSGYKGVTWNGIKKRWMARLHMPGGKRLTVGYFTDRQKAGEAVKQKRMEIYCNG